MSPAVFLGALAVFGVGGFLAGREVGHAEGYKEMAAAIERQRAEYEKRDGEVVNGWAAAVGVLRDRLSRRMAPTPPVGDTAGHLPPGSGPQTAPGANDPATRVAAAGELDRARAQYAALASACGKVAVDLRALQRWAQP